MRASSRILIVVSAAALLACGAYAQDAFQATIPVASQPIGYQPITNEGRVDWIVANTLGWPSLVAGLVSAGLGTELDRPREYGPTALGFAKRYGMRLTGIAVQNTMDAGIGAVLGEDPRYFRDGDGEPFGHRLRHVVAWTFLARNSDGDVLPAYARFAGIAGSNFLSNTWRPDSEANTRSAVARIGLGLLGRMSKNAYDEFWPDVKDRVLNGRR